MKFFFSIALFFISAFAQRASIGLPAEEQHINSGKDVVIQIQRPVSWSPCNCHYNISFCLISYPELSEWVQGDGCRNWPLFVSIIALQKRRRSSWHDSVQRSFQPQVSREQPAPI